ncbi:MAG: HEAT repeat domain-containing protein [Pyrinomonadaceae bacterium]
MAETASNNHHPLTSPGTSEQMPTRRRTPWPLAVVAVLFVVVPFMYWYGTWFGRQLNDEEIGEYLGEEKNPRHAQHALAQLAERMERGDEEVKRWYPQIIALAGNSQTDVRMTAAWVMGQDNRAAGFLVPLRQLTSDPEPIVRRNAALALVRFNDAGGRAELLAMLRPYAVKSPVGGTLASALPEGSRVKREAMLARVTDVSGHTLEVRSPLPGPVEKVLAAGGAQISEGGELVVLGPDGGSVWESLRALYVVGLKEDLPEVERYAQGVAGMSEEIKKQAALTADAIRRRTATQ